MSDCSWTNPGSGGEIGHVGEREVNCRRKVFEKDKGILFRAQVVRSAFNEVGKHAESSAQAPGMYTKCSVSTCHCCYQSPSP